MHVIVLANQKGGVGKSTLCRNLAVAAGAGAVLIDIDPQGSTTAFYNRRKAAEPPLITLMGSLTETVEKLREANAQLVFIDTATGLSPGLAEAVGLADLVLVPVKASPDDLDSVGPALQLIEQSGRPFAFVLSMIKHRTRLATEALAALAQHGKVAPVMIGDRVEYPTAALTGIGVTEGTETAAAQEIRSLLTYVLTQLAKGARQ